MLSATPRLIYDSNATPIDSNPTNLRAVGDEVIFLATRRGGEVSLFSSNGTLDGTQSLLSANSGTATRFGAWLESLGNLAVFPYSTHAAGMELWRTDGTETGTRMLVDIDPGASKSGVFDDSLVGVASDRLYFLGDDGIHGKELWVTDGTEAGTHIVVDLAPGAADLAFSNPVIMNDILYFVTSDAEHGQEIWRTDGTASGTIVLEVRPGTQGSSAANLTVVGDRLYFTGTDGESGIELWVTDGTPEGTRIVKDIYPGGLINIGTGQVTRPNSSNPSNLVSFAGKLFFRANNSSEACVGACPLYETDGTEAGTIRSTRGSIPSNFVEWEGSFYYATKSVFTPNNLTRSTNGVETTVYSGPVLNGRILDFHVSGDKMYFRATGDGTTMWMTDGTPEGTQQIAGGTNPTSLPIQAGGNVFFTAKDDVQASGNELWVLSKESNSQNLLIDLSPGNGSTTKTFFPVEDRIYFTNPNRDWASDSVWVSRGTPENTGPVDPSSYSDFDEIIHGSANGVLYYTKSTHSGVYYLATASPDGMTRILSPLPSQPISDLSFELGGQFYFFVRDSEQRIQLWESDGTAFGTMARKTFGVGAEVQFAEADESTAFFAINDPDARALNVWTFELTDAQPRIAKELVLNANVTEAAVFGGALYAGLQSASNLSLRMPVRIAPDPNVEILLLSTPNPYLIIPPRFQFTPFGDHVAYIVTNSAVSRTELWMTDGTAAGTRWYGDLAENNLDLLTCGVPIAGLGDRLLYGYHNGDAVELRVTDGTEEGTVVIVGDYQGDAEYLPSCFINLATVNNQVYFPGYTPETGIELWHSDGTPQGTGMVADINPGSGDSYPSALKVEGDSLVFLAYEEQHGQEWWLLSDMEASVSFTETSFAIKEGDDAVTVEAVLTVSAPLAEDLTVSLVVSSELATSADYGLSRTFSYFFLPPVQRARARQSFTLQANDDMWVEGDEWDRVLDLVSSTPTTGH
ncbi:MAG: hypothetical protein R3C99_27345 [Pirellulaceae bacterium]